MRSAAAAAEVFFHLPVRPSVRRSLNTAACNLQLQDDTPFVLADLAGWGISNIEYAPFCFENASSCLAESEEWIVVATSEPQVGLII